MKLTVESVPGFHLLKDLDRGGHVVAQATRPEYAAEIVRRVNACNGLAPILEAAREALALLTGDEYLSERSERAASARDCLEMALLELDGGAP